MDDHPSLRNIPCLKMQTPFLEALRPLKRLCSMNSLALFMQHLLILIYFKYLTICKKNKLAVIKIP